MGHETTSKYIEELQKENPPIDYKIFEQIKNDFISKYGTSSDYITERIINYFDREIQYINRHELPFELIDTNHGLIKGYIEDIMNDDGHLLNQYIIKSIKDNIMPFGWVWGENIHKVQYAAGILSHIIQDLKILQMFEQDEKALFVKTRDKHKITDAVDLLLSCTDDPHITHYLNEMKIEKNNISKARLLSSFFCQYTKMFIEGFNTNKSIATKLSGEIMVKVFESKKDYRIYKHQETINYREFMLTRYISKP